MSKVNLAMQSGGSSSQRKKLKIVASARIYSLIRQTTISATIAMALILLTGEMSFCLDKDLTQSLDTSADLTNMSLQDLMQMDVATVSGASRFEQEVTDAPSSVTIVTSDEIKKYGYRTLADILRSVPGFFVTYDRNYNYFGSRGFGPPGEFNTRYLLLVDGHRINDNIYDQATIGTEFPVDIDLIDRIEIIRGPSSSLYGSNAFLGTINIILKRGRDVDGTEISGAAGSFNTYKGRISYGKKFQSGPEILLSGSIMDSAGQSHLYFKEFDNPATNYGITEHTDYDRSYSFFTKLSFNDFTLEGVYSYREKGIPTGSYGTVFNDPNNRTIDKYGFVELKYDHVFENQLEVMARGFYDHVDYHGEYIYDRSANPGDPPLLVTNEDPAKGRWLGGEVLLTKELLNRHRVSLGTEYRYNISQDQADYDSVPFIQYLNDKRHSDVWSVYIQDEFHILDNLILNAGMRHDHYSTFGGTTNPRAALIYKPFEGTALKFLFGQAFRAPNAYESFYSDGIYQKQNLHLKPENITTYELVYEQYFAEHFRSSVTGFHQIIKDIITAQLDPVDNLLVYKNTDEVESKGVELALEGKWSNGLRVQASYSFQDVKNRNTGEMLRNSPRHLAKYNMIVPLVREKLFAGAEVQYTSSRKSVNDNTAGGFFITNLTLFSHNVLKDLEFSASIYNLFDKKYGDPGGSEQIMDIIEQDGRTFRLKLTYRF